MVIAVDGVFAWLRSLRGAAAGSDLVIRIIWSRAI